MYICIQNLGAISFVPRPHALTRKGSGDNQKNSLAFKIGSAEECKCANQYYSGSNVIGAHTAQVCSMDTVTRPLMYC